MLDALLDAYVEQDQGRAELVAAGFDGELVDRVVRLVDAAEYKRRQNPPGPKTTSRAFGRDRRLPITSRWREVAAPDRRRAPRGAARAGASAGWSGPGTSAGGPESREARPMSELPSLYGGVTNRRVTPRDLQRAKDRGERWPMLTSYDALTAGLFDEAGIPVLLVGDSAANVVLGYETTVRVSVDELLPMVQAVVRATSAGARGRRPAVRQLPGLAAAGARDRRALPARGRRAGGQARGRRARGRRRSSCSCSRASPWSATSGSPRSPSWSAAAGCRAAATARRRCSTTRSPCRRPARSPSCSRRCPADLAARVTKELTVPTVGIGAGAGCDAQVLVWTDMAGLTPGGPLTFVKRYADLRGVLAQAARDYADDVREGRFPGPEHAFD